MKQPSIPPIIQDIMTRTTIRVEGVLTEFQTPILPKISGDMTRDGLHKLHWMIIGNMVSMRSNIGGDCHRHLALTMAVEDYMTQTGYMFVTPHNLGYSPSTMKITHEQALRTERLQKNQALFRRYTAVYVVI